MIIDTEDGGTINLHHPDGRNYAVKWEIEITATSFAEAARLAYEIQRDPESLPPVFEVTDTETGTTVTLDMEKG